VEKDVVLLLRVVEFMSLGPIIADRIGINLAIMIKAARSN